MRYHKGKVNPKNIHTLKRERWGRFSLALAFPGTSARGTVKICMCDIENFLHLHAFAGVSEEMVCV